MFNVSAQHPGTRALLQKGSRSPHWDPLSVLEAAKELVSDLFRKDPGPRSGSFMPDVDAALRAIANSKVEQDLRFLETPWRAVHQTQQAALGVPYRAANQWMDRPAGGPTPRASQGPTQGSIPGAAQPVQGSVPGAPGQATQPDPGQPPPKDKPAEPGLLDNPLAVAVIAITLGIMTFALVSKRPSPSMVVLRGPGP